MLNNVNMIFCLLPVPLYYYIVNIELAYWINSLSLSWCGCFFTVTSSMTIKERANHQMMIFHQLATDFCQSVIAV